MHWDITEERTDENGRKYRILSGLHIFSSDCFTVYDKIISTKIFALSNEETEHCEVMGSAEGEDFKHCIELGLQGEKDFFKRVYGYQIVEPDSPEYKFAISFYAQKQSS